MIDWDDAYEGIKQDYNRWWWRRHAAWFLDWIRDLIRYTRGEL